MYVIVGLGNPGIEYIGTRHNIGFDFVNFLSKKWKIKFETLKWRSEVGEGIVQFEKKEERIILTKPMTYMNLSGEAVKEIVRNLNLSLEHLVIVHDDVDLPPGGVHFIKDRGDGGHKGVTSVVHHLNSKDFFRLRIGIGAPVDNDDMVNYVLSGIPLKDKKLILKAFDLGEEILKTFIIYGEKKAISKSNKKGIY